MSKICPNCQAEYSDSDNFCPKCGVGLIEKTDHKNPAIILGDANAITGGININQSKNVVTHDVHYHTTNIQERIKSEAELKLEATNRIRAKAEEFLAEKGRIDMVAIGELQHFASQLGIDDNSFRGIIKYVRSNRVDASHELSATNSRYLHQAEQAIKSNDMECLMNLLPRLESMASISQDDNVQYLYHLTLALFNPRKSMEAYEHQTDENYWRTFWAIISYIRVNKNAEASRLLARFDPIRYDKSEDDQILLEAYFNLMKNDKDGTKSFLNEIKGTLSEQLSPFLQDINLKLSNDEADLSLNELFESGFYFQWILLKYDDELCHLGHCYRSGQGVSQNDEEAIKWFKKAAEAGNTNAMTELGYSYGMGMLGLDKNEEEATKWFRKAAEFGDAAAMNHLGDWYRNGWFKKQDDDEAFKWYRKAAETGNIDAMISLGDCYLWGRGVIKSKRSAFRWYRKAAETGDITSMIKLGDCYYSDYRDTEEAFKWYSKAADIPKGLKCSFSDFSNFEAAQKYYHKWGMKYLKGEGVCKDDVIARALLILSVKIGSLALDPKDAGEYFDKWENHYCDEAKICNYEDSAEFFSSLAFYLSLESMEAWDNRSTENKSKTFYDAVDKDPDSSKIKDLQKLAEAGDSNAMGELGHCYENGNGVGQDCNEAAKWYRKAADAGNAWAMCQLGNLYLNGRGVIQNDFEAYNWYCKGAEAGESASIANMGWCLEFGRGVEANPIEALKWYQKAVDAGNAWAMDCLGWLFFNGKGVNKNYTEAEKWFRKAVEHDNKNALNGLGRCYSEGYGNDNEAYKWFCKGAEAGVSASIANIGWCYEFGRGVEANPVEAMNWYQKALDNGYQMDDWLSQRMEECKLKMPSRPTAKIVSIWAMNTNPHDMSGNNYGNDSSIIVHCYIKVDNMNGREGKAVLTMSTNGVSFNKTESLVPIYDLAEWKDFRFPIYANDIINLIEKGRHQFLAQVDIYDDQNNCMTSSSVYVNIKYSTGIFSGTKVEVV